MQAQNAGFWLLSVSKYYRLMFRCLLMLMLCAVSASAFTQPSSSRKGLRVRFVPVMGQRPLQLYEGAATDSLRITTFRCYISSISLKGPAGFTFRDTIPHLIDASDESSLVITLPIGPGAKYDELFFTLGIDSATSCSGAHGGDLDPAKGMYWAWQSGYINMKLEGISPASTARKHQFQFHLGGYAHPYEATQVVRLPVSQSGSLIVSIDLGLFLSVQDLAQEPSVMIPGPRAFELSQKATGMFKAVSN